MAGKPLVESMNVISSHAKLRATLRFADSLFVAGDAVSGKMEVECKADTGLAMGIIMVELFGVEGAYCMFSSLALITYLYSRVDFTRSLGYSAFSTR